MAEMKDSTAWVLTGVSFAIAGLILWLVFWAVGEVSGLANQAAVVLGGVFLFAMVFWVLEFVVQKFAPREETDEPKPVPVWVNYHGTAFGLYFGARSIYGLNENEVGEQWWWWSVIGVPLCGSMLAYNLYDLYRHRHERARQREERWAPWG